MNRTAAARLSVLLAAGIPFFLSACGGGGASGSGGSSNSALNMAGTWTVTTVSTQGHGSFSGTAAVSQSGEGLGVNGATTLAAPVGQIAISQTGTALTGILSNSIQKVGYNFIGTLSSSNFTVTGSTLCSYHSAQGTTQSTISITGTVTSNSATGTYTITQGSGCYNSSDAGTFVATKQ
jgi:hypothetical protein